MHWFERRLHAHLAYRSARVFRRSVRRWANLLAPEVFGGPAKPVPTSVTQRWARDEINAEINAGSLRAVVCAARTTPPASLPRRGEARRAGTVPGLPPCPPGARRRLDLAALQRRWDAMSEQRHPLHALVEIALHRPRLTSTSTSQEAVQLIADELRPLAKLVPRLEMAMVTGGMTPDDYAQVGDLLANLAARWRALPDIPSDTPPRLTPAS